MVIVISITSVQGGETYNQDDVNISCYNERGGFMNIISFKELHLWEGIGF